MNLARLAILILYVAAAFVAFGWWIVDPDVRAAVGLIALGLALEQLAGYAATRVAG